MKWIEWAVVGVLIFFPFATINQIDVELMRQTMLLELRYDAAMDAAVDAAAQALIINADQQHESRYESVKQVTVNKEEALTAFYRTLYTNFGISSDPVSQGVLQRYIPVIIVIGYDGFYVYAEDEWTDRNGHTVMASAWGTKQPYAYTDSSGNSYSFTLDEQVLVYVAATRSWHEGFRRDIQAEANIPLLRDATLFNEVRRSTIVGAIQDELSYRINKHNEVALRNGLSYTFTFPSIPMEEWHNTIADVGVVAFMQGIPIGHKVYNSYALGGSRVMKPTEIVGAMKDNMKVYYRRTCPFSYPIEETFTSEKAAAKQGYMPLSCSSF
ncbi:hypothetical protein [Paenibacillus woosongensis]|uniref:F0F1-type ATP synthase n=1 Tax=Paenibacillus woosongensis TaxID=307580 RepID=A0A7X2Z0B5_9BACL|nr:hypothetical protein [Paenibacillus woosongensis]MUG44501.1 hypothetical protein [Paenibacillus woosongensis]